MRSRQVRCYCGKESQITGGNLAEEKASTDFTPYMNVKNGLEMVWICPECEKVVAPALKDILRIFGSEARYISFLNKFAKKNNP
jgi:hypothetical protein